MVARSTDGHELCPGGIGHRERQAFDEAEALGACVPAGDLRGDRQEQLVEQAGPEQVADQVGATLAQDQAGARRTGDLDQLRSGHAATASGDLDPGIRADVGRLEAPGAHRRGRDDHRHVRGRQPGMARIEPAAGRSHDRRRLARGDPQSRPPRRVRLA